MPRFAKGVFAEMLAAQHEGYETGSSAVVEQFLLDHFGTIPQWAVRELNNTISNINILNPPKPEDSPHTWRVRDLPGMEDATDIDNLVQIGPKEWGEIRTLRVTVTGNTTIQDVLDEIQDLIDKWNDESGKRAQAYLLKEFWRVR